jgi:hypothetical protein
LGIPIQRSAVGFQFDAASTIRELLCPIAEPRECKMPPHSSEVDESPPLAAGIFNADGRDRTKGASRRKPGERENGQERTGHKNIC